MLDLLAAEYLILHDDSKNLGANREAENFKLKQMSEKWEVVRAIREYVDIF